MTTLPAVDWTRPEGDDSSAGPPPPWVDKDGTPDLDALMSMRDQLENQDLDGDC